MKADYISTGPGDNYNGFVFNFGSAGGGGTNQLTNGSFESPDASAGDVACSDNWSCFNAAFTSSNNFMPGGGFVNPAAYSGSQVLKQYGADGGATQKIPASPGDTVNASVYAMNWLGDEFNNLALLQIAYLDAGGGVISVNEIFADTAGNQAYQLLPQDGGEPGDWTLMEVSGVAPAGTVEAQILLLHIDIGQGGGSIFWDDASLAIGGATSPGPGGDISG